MSVSARDGRTGQPHGGLSVSHIAWFAAAFGFALVAGSIALVSTARGQQPGFYLKMFAAPRGEMVMSRFAKVGPFLDISVCYAAGAITIDGMNALHQDKDFMGRCDGGILLTGRIIAERALQLLPQDSQQGEIRP